MIRLQQDVDVAKYDQTRHLKSQNVIHSMTKILPDKISFYSMIII